MQICLAVGDFCSRNEAQCLAGRGQALCPVSEGVAPRDLQNHAPTHTLLETQVCRGLGISRAYKWAKAQTREPALNGLGAGYTTWVSKLCQCSNTEPEKPLFFLFHICFEAFSFIPSPQVSAAGPSWGLAMGLEGASAKRHSAPCAGQWCSPQGSALCSAPASHLSQSSPFFFVVSPAIK